MRDPGSVLLDAGFPAEALPYLLKAHAEDPESIQHLNNLSVCHRQLGDFMSAKELAVQALKIDGREPMVWSNLGSICEDLGNFELALKAYEAANMLAPDNQNISIGLAYALMRHERFAEAWPHWMFGRFMTSWQPLPDIPIWQGEDNLSGKRILVNREGGFGDGIMFARWIPALGNRGAKVMYRVWDSLASLLMDYPDWMSLPESWEIPKCDLQCALMSLPALLGMKSLADIPPGICLSSPSPRPARRTTYAGLCWRAEENAVSRRHRSIPEEALQPLEGIRGVHWFSLCPHGKDLRRNGDFDTPPWIADPTADFATWADTAEFIAGLDLVVTVDTAIAHLAGSMGIPTWILVPHRSDWKWFLDRDDTPWYPTAKLIRQDDLHSWDSVIERVRKELESQ